MSGDPSDYEAGVAAAVMGWGSTGSQGLSSVLMQADVPTVCKPTRRCDRRTG